MNGPVLDPRRMQRAVVWLLLYLSASSSSGAIAAIDGTRLKYGGLSTGLEEIYAVVVAPRILTAKSGLSLDSIVIILLSLADKAVVLKFLAPIFHLAAAFDSPHIEMKSCFINAE